MAENKVPREKQLGEKREGTFHFNPGNMAGKAAKIGELSREGESQPNETADEAPESGGRLTKTYRELAQKVWRDAEGAAATDQSRLNKHADTLEEKALAPPVGSSQRGT